MGIPVVIVTNGGIAVTPVTSGAPSMTVAPRGQPIRLAYNAMPFVISGVPPLVDFNWQEFDLIAGNGGQWIGFSDGGATRPQPAFGSVGSQPTTVTTLLALYDDTNSDVYLAVFAGDYVDEMDGLILSIGGFALAPFEIELISGNTWIRYNGTGDLTAGATYQVEFS